MIEVIDLTKHYGDKIAVDHASFAAPDGMVTGFLGPNGAGKSTSMRAIMGLDRPTGGHATVNGKHISQHAAPMREVGALLDAKSVAPGRTARAHLRALAATHGIGKRRVDEVLGMTGLDKVADKRVKGFSLGMGQRLGIASALLADPQTLVMDEPVNGLDPDGVRWVRDMSRHFAAEGRCVLLSSHLMSEVELTADRVVIIGRGRILADTSVADFTAEAANNAIAVRTSDDVAFSTLLQGAGAILASGSAGLSVVGLEAADIARLAVRANLDLHELTHTAATLEEAYMKLTADQVEYKSGPSLEAVAP